MSTNMVIRNARLSFPALFTPKASPQGGEPKYQATLLIPKTDVATKQAIDLCIVAAKTAGASKFGGQVPVSVRTTLYDGDGVSPNTGEPFGEECKGHWVLRTSSLNKPGIVDENVQPILSQDKIYAGCYVNADINFYAYNTNNSKGVSCGLNNIQFAGHGEPFSSRQAAEDVFSAVGLQTQNNAPQFQQAPAPQGYTAPPVQQVSQAQYQPPQGYQAPQGYQQPGDPAPYQPQYDQYGNQIG